jgi:hypothetical protein
MEEPIIRNMKWETYLAILREIIDERKEDRYGLLFGEEKKDPVNSKLYAMGVRDNLRLGVSTTAENWLEFIANGSQRFVNITSSETRLSYQGIYHLKYPDNKEGSCLYIIRDLGSDGFIQTDLHERGSNIPIAEALFDLYQISKQKGTLLITKTPTYERKHQFIGYLITDEE